MRRVKSPPRDRVSKVSAQDARSLRHRRRASARRSARVWEHPLVVHEAARDVVRRLKGTPAYVQSRRERKKVEMLFAHLKRILKLTRLRLLTRRSNGRLYNVWGLRRARFALRPNGILAVWSGSPDRKFKARLQRCGFAVDEQRVHANGRNGRRHVLWLATRPGDTSW